MFYVELLLLSIIVCYIVDLSGVIDSIKIAILEAFTYIKNPNPSMISFKPLDCSRCMTFWSCIVYSISCHAFNLWTLAYISLLSFLASNISGFMQLVKELLVHIETMLYEKYIYNKK